MKIKRALVVLATALAVTGCTPISMEDVTESLGVQEESASDDATAEESLTAESTEETTEASTDASADETAVVEGEPVSEDVYRRG